MIVMVGDGSYLMLHTELVTAVAEGIKIIVVLIQNHGLRLDRPPLRDRRLRALRHAATASSDPETLDFQGERDPARSTSPRTRAATAST